MDDDIYTEQDKEYLKRSEVDMLEPEERQQLERGMFVMKILWGAFFSALVIYLIIGHVIGTNAIDTKLDNFTFRVVTATLGVIACVILATAYFLRKLLLKAQPVSSTLRIIQQMLTAVTPPFPLAYHQAVSKYMAALMICIAFSESVGIFGLVLFLISGEFVILYSFIVVSALALYFFRPKFADLERLALDMKRLENSG